MVPEVVLRGPDKRRGIQQEVVAVRGDMAGDQICCERGEKVIDFFRTDDFDEQEAMGGGGLEDGGDFISGGGAEQSRLAVADGQGAQVLNEIAVRGFD